MDLVPKSNVFVVVSLVVHGSPHKTVRGVFGTAAEAVHALKQFPNDLKPQVHFRRSAQLRNTVIEFNRSRSGEHVAFAGPEYRFSANELSLSIFVKGREVARASTLELAGTGPLAAITMADLDGWAIDAMTNGF
jgi:hypothetical protein